MPLFSLSSLALTQGVHEFHVWELVPERPFASLHVMIAADADAARTLERVKAILHAHRIHSSTIQLEVARARADAAAADDTTRQIASEAANGGEAKRAEVAVPVAAKAEHKQWEEEEGEVKDEEEAVSEEAACMEPLCGAGDCKNFCCEGERAKLLRPR